MNRQARSWADKCGHHTRSSFFLLHNKTLKLQELYLVLCFLLGNFSASGVYMPTFRNTLFHFQRQVDVSSFSFLVHSTHIYLPMKMGQSVMKRRHINSRRWVITQKKAYNIQNTAKAWNQENFVLSHKIHSPSHSWLQKCISFCAVWARVFSNHSLVTYILKLCK